MSDKFAKVILIVMTIGYIIGIFFGRDLLERVIIAVAGLPALVALLMIYNYKRKL